MKHPPEVAGEVLAVMTAAMNEDYGTASELIKEHPKPFELTMGAFSMAIAAINVISEILHIDPKGVMQQLGLAAALAQEET